MIKLSQIVVKLKSPVLRIGLFCLLLLAGCNKATNPDDVTIRFWTALAENNLDNAKYYSTEESVQLFNEKLRNASVQISKVKYDCDGATVETQISLQSAVVSSSFKTFLIRDQEKDQWKVDYPRTINNISDKGFKNIITTLKETGTVVKEKVQFKTFFKELWQTIVAVFKKLKAKLLS